MGVELGLFSSCYEPARARPGAGKALAVDGNNLERKQRFNKQGPCSACYIVSG